MCVLVEDADCTSRLCGSWRVRWYNTLVLCRVVCCSLFEELCDEAKLLVQKTAEESVLHASTPKTFEKRLT